MEPGKKIVLYPHPALRHPAKPLSAIDAEVRRYAGRMLELMYENKGLGLAGPQIALPVQLLVMNFEGEAEKKDMEVVAINPVIMDRKGTQEGDEGCLSFPDLYQKVRRAKTVVVQYYDLSGNLREMTAHELPARLWQHEIDHLHGRPGLRGIVGDLVVLCRGGHLGGGQAHQGVAVGRGNVNARSEQFLDGETNPLRSHLRAAAENARNAGLRDA